MWGVEKSKKRKRKEKALSMKKRKGEAVDLAPT